MDNVQLREDTGVVWLASSLDPDSALQTTRHSRTLLLINSDGRQWQFEPRESNLTTGCAVWLKPNECSLGSNSGLEENGLKLCGSAGLMGGCLYIAERRGSMKVRTQ